MYKLVKAKYNDTIIECYPLACFLWDTFEINKKTHKFLWLAWNTEKIIKKNRMCALIFIPWKHSEKGLDIIPLDDILATMDEFSKNWIKEDQFISENDEDSLYKEKVVIKQFFGDQLIINNNEFMAQCVNHEYRECLKLLYNEKPELLHLEFDEETFLDVKKEMFIFNVNYLVSYGEEPEMTLIDELGHEYFVIAYSDYVDFYNENNVYFKLSKINDVFGYIPHRVISYTDDFGEDLSIDIRSKSEIIDGRLWKFGNKN